MARSSNVTVENNFSKGLITESTAMNSAENSVVETANCVYLRNGSVVRRYGIDFETGATKSTFLSLGVFSEPIAADPTYDPPFNQIAISEFEWSTNFEGGGTNFLAVQLGDTIRFFEIDDNNKVSSNLKSFLVKLSSKRTTPVLESDVANVTGTVVVDDTLISSLASSGGTFTVTKDGVTSTITFAATTMDTKDLFEAALLDQVSVELSMTAEIDVNGFVHLSCLPDDNGSFTVGGTIDVFTSFGIVEQEYTFDTENFYEAIARQPCSFAQGLGYLFVCHPVCEPFYIEYSASDDSISTKVIDLQVRDFTYLDDGTKPDVRPTSLSHLHRYNLYNQGWYAKAISVLGGTVSEEPNVLSFWSSHRSDYPANSDIWWTFKNGSGQFQPTEMKNPASTTLAPNGHYIYSAFSTNRKTATGTTLSGLPEESSGPQRPSTVAFFSSRVWYSGVNSEEYAVRIYFSQFVQSTAEFGKCYQNADPTSETISDLLETDGGVIVIPDAVAIVGLVPIGRSLLVFAKNGVWSIGGSANGQGFRANDYTITRLGFTPTDATFSIVNAESTPFWWSANGIYTVQADPSTGELTVVNISDTTIKSVLLSIPQDNIPFVKGVYNRIDKTIQWLYRSIPATTTLTNFQYDKLLVLNTLSGSFSTLSISSSTPFVSGAFFSQKATADPLASNDSASVVNYVTTGFFGASGAMAFTISQFNEETFVDWKTVDGTGKDFSSYFISGYRIRGDLLRKFQSNYIVVVSEILANSSCLLQGIWDYNALSGGRLTSSQEVYESQTGKDYSRRKLKLRGNGYSLQLKFRSISGKPFKIIGWVTAETGNNVP